jgi:methionyl-tRNA formyltransferase
MQLDQLMDHGPIIAQQTIHISPTDTYIELEQKIIQTSTTLLLEYLPPFLAGQITPKPQDHTQASIVSMVQKQDGQINWQKHTAQDIINLYRAYINWPQVYTYLNTDKKVIFEQIQFQVNQSNKLQPGHWQLDQQNNQLIIGTIDGNIAVTQLKIEGKNSIDPKSFANGYKDIYFIT